jgi:predicted nucleotidyltransferase
MNFNISDHTILKVRHGSWAYGLNVEGSDVDIKGVCIEPLEYHFGFAKNFEQHVQEVSKGHPNDLVIMSLKKFCKLACDSNPNIIECLFGADEDVLFIDSFGEELRAFRDNFLSLKARHTFAGYAHSQLKRIKSHRGWLLNPPQEPPSRKSFGLPESHGVTKTELGAFENLQASGSDVGLSKEVLDLYSREKAWKNMHQQWSQYQNWKTSRNPVRAELEEKFGLDCKHASHLIRLMRMCKEILQLGTVVVKRPDRKELLNIRNGGRDYDSIVEEAERLDAECAELYKTSKVLPHSPNVNKIDAFVVDLTDRYLKVKG